jgi:hypothetical protein
MSEGPEYPRQLRESDLIASGFKIDIGYRETKGIHHYHHHDGGHNNQPSNDGFLSEILHPTRSASRP